MSRDTGEYQNLGTIILDVLLHFIQGLNVLQSGNELLSLRGASPIGLYNSS